MKAKKKQYQYAHIMWADNKKFYAGLISLMSSFWGDSDEIGMCFVTPYKSVYENFRDKTDNIFYVETKRPKSCKVLKIASSMADNLIIHSIPSIAYACFIPRKILRNSIWRTWGHDVLYHPNKNRPIENIAKKVFNMIWKKKTSYFFGIGGANYIDEVNVRNCLGDNKYYNLSYGTGEYYDIIQKERTKEKECDKEHLDVMVGHYGHSLDNHISILESLYHLKENIRVVLVLSYGNEAYIKKVCEELDKRWEGHSLIVKDFISSEEYISLINNMDVIILDGKVAYALGNLQLAISLNKTLVLNEHGIIRKALNELKINTISSSLLPEISIEELKKTPDYDSNIEAKKVMVSSKKERIDEWKRALDDIKNNQL